MSLPRGFKALTLRFIYTYFSSTRVLTGYGLYIAIYCHLTAMPRRARLGRLRLLILLITVGAALLPDYAPRIMINRVTAHADAATSSALIYRKILWGLPDASRCLAHFRRQPCHDAAISSR